MAVDKSKGWICLWRCIQDNPFWTCEPFTRGQAWVDLLLLANHERTFFFKRNIKITVERGQVGRSEVELADRWKWSRTKVRKFLNDLEKEQQIKQQKNNLTQLLTIINWEEYQKKEQQLIQQKDSRKTAEEQQQDTYNNENNENNENKKSRKKSVALTRLPEDEFFAALESNPLYSGIDIRKLNEKLKVWCAGKGLQPTRQRLINWLNREDKIIDGGSKSGDNGTSTKRKGFVDAHPTGTNYLE